MERNTETAAAPVRRRVPFRCAGAMLAAIALGTQAMQGQAVRGVVTRGSTPIPGVVVQLIDSTEAIVARTLTDDGGAYRLLAPRAGTFRLTTRRIGFAPSTSSTVVLVDGETRELALRVDGIVISLDTVRVRTDRGQCGKADKKNAEITMIWEQARTALMATEASLSGRSISVALLSYSRTHHADGTRSLEYVTLIEADSVVQPWVSPSFTELQRTGYVIPYQDSVVYFGPGLDVLISPEFSNAHCFRVAAADSARVALSFEPAKPRKGIAELKGVVWLDRRTAELRSLVFGYTNIAAMYDSAGAGGRIEFTALRDGSWAIARWSIQTPVLGMRAIYPRGASPLHVTAIENTGGDLLVARRSTDTLWSRMLPPVAGVVTDSATGAPIARARLSLRGTDWKTSSDATGRFEFRGVLPGDYTMLINTPSLDSVGAATTVPLLVADSVARLTVKVAGARRVLPVVCALSADSLARRRDFGMLRGVATFAEPPTTAAPIDITIQWRDSAAQTTRTRQVRADATGRYRACDVPVGAELEVRAEAAPMSSAPAVLRLAPGSPFGQLDLALENPVANLAVLRGVVVDAADKPVANVTVEITALGLRAITDSSGAFRLARVPEGNQRLTLRRVGYGAEDAELAVAGGQVMERRFTLSAVTALSTVNTTASTSGIKEFDEHRRVGLGTFFTREDLAKQEARRLSDIMATVSGVRIVPMTGGKAALSSSRRPPSLTGGQCFAMIYRDKSVLYGGREGEPVPNLNEIMVGDIEAIEYFASPAETPAEYSGLQSPCGVLVIHTRR